MYIVCSLSTLTGMFTFLRSKICQVGNDFLQSLVHADSFTVVYDRDDQLGYSQFPAVGDEMPGFSHTNVNVYCLVIIAITVFLVIVLCRC